MKHHRRPCNECPWSKETSPGQFPLSRSVSEKQLLLVEQQGQSLHIIDPDDPARTCCGRPLAGDGDQEDLTPAPWHGDAAGPRQRTVYDVRWKGHLYSICRRCREKAAIK